MTEDNRLRLLSLAKALGKKFDMSTFDKRLFLQKITYLAQEAGMHFGFHFGWYVHGPYSPTLTKEAFELEDLLRSAGSCSVDLPKVHLDSSKVQIMKNILSDIGQKREGTEYWLELLASVHFLCKYAYPKAKDDNEVTKRLEALKPGRYNPDTIKNAFELLQEYGLI